MTNTQTLPGLFLSKLHRFCLHKILYRSKHEYYIIYTEIDVGVFRRIFQLGRGGYTPKKCWPTKSRQIQGVSNPNFDDPIYANKKTSLSPHSTIWYIFDKDSWLNSKSDNKTYETDINTQLFPSQFTKFKCW